MVSVVRERRERPRSGRALPLRREPVHGDDDVRAATTSIFFHCRRSCS
jgi:hypothetical protein